MKHNITVLVFSGRSNGNCVKIGEFIQEYYKRANVCLFAIRNLMPCGNCNYECLMPDRKCPDLSKEFAEIMDTVSASDLVYFVVPNYCGFPCSLYFAFNEHSVGYFDMNRSALKQYMAVKKRFIIISNTEREEFVSAMQQQTEQAPDIFYMKTSKYEKKSISGDLLDSAEASADLKRFLDNCAI